MSKARQPSFRTVADAPGGPPFQVAQFTRVIVLWHDRAKTQKLLANFFSKGNRLSTRPGEVTQLLLELEQGNRAAESKLIALVYQELRRIAALYLRGEASSHSLQPTALVHEAYLRLVGIKSANWQGRSHFFAVSATIMRRILVDHARANKSAKRGEGTYTVTLDSAVLAAPERGPEILALDEALNRLAQLDARQSKIVELRFFAGMTEEEAGHVLGISTRTVKRDWRIAKAWLYKELQY
jgi:RNA polymerase sigma factor (TIGR02999 family)